MTRGNVVLSNCELNMFESAKCHAKPCSQSRLEHFSGPRLDIFHAVPDPKFDEGVLGKQNETDRSLNI